MRRWFLGLGLWPRVALPMTLGLFVLFVALTALGERAIQDGTEHILEERLVIAEMAAGQLDSLLQKAVSEVEQARRFADFDPSDPDLNEESHMLAHTYGRVGTFAPGITFLDTRGAVVLSYPPGLQAPGSDLSSLPHVAQALERRAVTISAPFRDSRSDQPVAAVTVPIHEGPRFLGLLSGLIHLGGQAILTPLEQAAEFGHTGHAILVDERGQTLASTFGLPFLSPGEHPTYYQEAMAEGQAAVETVPFQRDLAGDPEGNPHVMAFAPLHMAPWGVAVGGDEDETFAGVYRLRMGLVVLGVVAFSGTWVGTLLGTRWILQPVKRLTEAAKRIAGQHLDTPLDAPEGGEIGEMALALERMRYLLLANIEELSDWNDSLEARIAERTEQLQNQQTLVQHLLRRAIAGQEEERARLSRELHDEIGQTLTAVQLGLDRMARSLPGDDARLKDHLTRTRELTERALADLRRVITDLRPGVLDELGLVPALSWVADRILRPSDVAVSIQADGLVQRLPSEIETILFRIAQEAMSNVARHSRASRLSIDLVHTDGTVTMTLSDDGRGFESAAATSDAGPASRLGLAGIQERASLGGGQATVESAPGRGTTVRVTVPVPRSRLGKEERGGSPS